MNLDAKLVKTDISQDASRITLDLVTPKRELLSISFDCGEAQILLDALADALGRIDLQATQDRMLKRVMQLEGWGITRQPSSNRILLSFIMRGNIAVAFHLPMDAVPHYAQALSDASGSATAPFRDSR